MRGSALKPAPAVWVGDGWREEKMAGGAVLVLNQNYER
jgi:hypothetical protein